MNCEDKNFPYNLWENLTITHALGVTSRCKSKPERRERRP